MANEHQIELPEGTRKTHMVHVPVTERQYRALKEMALSRATSVAALLRAACRHAGLFGQPPVDHHPEGDATT